MSTQPPYDLSGLKAAPDARYWSLTPAQWACFALLGLGVPLLIRCLRTKHDDPRAFDLPKASLELEAAFPAADFEKAS